MKRDFATVWELKVSLSVITTDAGMEEIRDLMRSLVDREVADSVVPSSFLWNTRGALLTARTEGDPSVLVEIQSWTLDNCSPGPSGFELRSMRTAPLRKTEGWDGYVRD